METYLNYKSVDGCNDIKSAIEDTCRILGIIIPNSLLGLSDDCLSDFTHEILNSKLDDVPKASVDNVSMC